MSIASLKAGAAEKYYFEKDPIFNADGTNENTTWSGLGAEALGLKGSLDSNEFKNLLAGNAPDGTQLVKGGTTGEHRSALDIPLSAPKSVSHMALVGGDDRLVNAHDKAVKATMDFIEKNYAQARSYEKNEDGSLAKDAKGDPIRIKVTTGNLVVAQAKHSTSRGVDGQMPDPSLHTHNVVMNMTFDKDTGTFKALDTDNMFKDQALIADVYRSELAKEVKALGYGIETKANGTWDIAGSRAEVLENFSKRSAQIDAQVAEMRANGIKGSEDKLRSMAQHNMKSAKDPSISKDDLIANWKEQHQAMGISINSIKQDMKDVGATMNGGEKMTAKQTLEHVASLLTRNEAVMTKEQLLKEGLKMSRGDLSVADLQKELNSVKKIGQKNDSDLKLLKDGNFTTKAVFDLEKEFAARLERMNKREFKAIASSPELAEKLIGIYEKEKGFTMTAGQKEVVMESLLSTKQIRVTNGVAGAGKTTIMDAVKFCSDLASSIKIDFSAVAPTGKAAAEIKAATGIESSTVDSFVMNGGASGSVDASKHYSFDADARTSLNKTDSEFFGGINISAGKENKGYAQAFEQKLQIGGGFFGIGIGNKEFSTISKTRSTKFGEFKEVKKEKIRSGQFKGAVKDTTLKVKGNVMKSSSTIKLTDGTIIKSDSESWKPTQRKSFIPGGRDVDTGFISKSASSKEILTADGKKGLMQAEKSSYGFIYSHEKVVSKQQTDGGFKLSGQEKTGFGGFAIATKREEIRDKNNNIIKATTVKQKTFLGIKIGVASVIEEGGNLTTGKYVIENGQMRVTEAEQTKLNASNIESVNSQLNANSKILETDKILIVDETSLLGVKNANALLKIAEESNSRIDFTGDFRQIQSISFGDAFNYVKEVAGFVDLKDSVRQKTTQTREIANFVNVGDIKGALEKMDTQTRRFGEVDSRGKMSNMVELKTLHQQTDFLAQYVLEAPNKTLAAADLRVEVNAINDKVRDALWGADKGKEFTVIAKQNMDPFKMRYAEAYKVGDIVKGGDLDFKNTFKVQSVDTKTNIVTLKDKAGVVSTLNVSKVGHNLSIDREEKKTFRVDDKVVFLSNDKKFLKVNNGEFGHITKVEGSKITVQMESDKNRVIVVDMDKYRNLDHGYAMTLVKGQGVTTERMGALMNSSNGSMNNANVTTVSATRAKEETLIITDDVEKLTSQALVKQEKTSTLKSDNVESKKDKDISASTSDIKSAIETAKKDVSVLVKADSVKGDIKVSVVAKDVKSDTKVSVKAQDVKADKKVFVKAEDVKPDTKVSVKDSDLKVPSGTGATKVAALAKDVKDDVKVSVRADSVQKDVKVVAEVKDVKTTAKVSVKAENVKADTKVEVKTSELKSPDTKMESKAKDVKADAVVVAKVSDIKADVKLEIKASDVKSEAKISVDRDDIKRGSNVEAKASDVKADTKVQVKRDELKPDTKLEVKADEVKKTVSVDVKASDVKSNLTVDTKVENVKTDAKAETKVENVKSDSSVEAKSQDIKQDVKLEVKASDVKQDAKVEAKIESVKPDAVVDTKVENVKSDSKVETKVENVKADSSVEAKAGDIKPDTKVEVKSTDVKDGVDISSVKDGKVSVNASDVKKDVKVSTKAQNVKADAKVETKQQNVKSDSKVTVKAKDVKSDSKVETKIKDVNPDKKVEVKASDVKKDVKVQTKQQNVKADANVKATVQDIKADSKLSANVSDVKSLDTKVSAKAGDIKENTKVQVVAGDTKVSSVKVDAKASDVKEDVKISVKREDVANDVKVDAKAGDIKDDATVSAKSQDVKPTTKADVKAQDVRPDAKVQTKFDDLKKDEFKSSDKDAVSDKDKGSVKDGASASFKKEVEKEESKSAVENKKIVERDSSADVKSSEKVEETKSAKTSASR